MERADETVIRAQLHRLLWNPGKLAAQPFCAIAADPINKLGSFTSPLASACLQMEGNDH